MDGKKPRQSSILELTRKDLNGIFLNGSTSSAFITSNKKELQKFIKNRAQVLAKEKFRGYQEVSEAKRSYSTLERTEQTQLKDIKMARQYANMTKA